MSEKLTSRRNVLYGAAAAGVAAPVLAACGSDGASEVVGTAPQSSGNGSTGTEGVPAKRPPAGSIATAEIPVGGGTIFPDDKLVVTQPEAGDFKAFSAVCTHSGCLVSEIADGNISCPCHFSKFSISDGSVQGGPAPSPLPEKNVTVSGDSLTVS